MYLLKIILALLSTRIINTVATNGNEEDCSINTAVSCHIKSNHRDCNDIEMKPRSCENVDITFGFRYCNSHKHNSIALVSGEMKVFLNSGEDFLQPLNDERELEPMNCREITKPYTVNSCDNSFHAELIAEGWVEGDIGCRNNHDYSFLRPLFQSLE